MSGWVRKQQRGVFRQRRASVACTTARTCLCCSGSSDPTGTGTGEAGPRAADRGSPRNLQIILRSGHSACQLPMTIASSCCSVFPLAYPSGWSDPKNMVVSMLSAVAFTADARPEVAARVDAPAERCLCPRIGAAGPSFRWQTKCCRQPPCPSTAGRCRWGPWLP